MQTTNGTPSASCQRSTLANALGVQAPKQPRTRREPSFTADTDGATIALVPTNRPGNFVRVLADDFAAYCERGFSQQWIVNSNGKGRNYVKVGLTGISGNLAMVARLLLNVPRGTRLSYADGNPMNLRRDNPICSGCPVRVATVTNQRRKLWKLTRERRLPAAVSATPRRLR